MLQPWRVRLMAQRKPAGSKEPALRAMELERIGIDGVVGRIRERIDDAPFYLSIDIDVLDPAHAPAPHSLGSGRIWGLTRPFAGWNVMSRGPSIKSDKPSDNGQLGVNWTAAPSLHCMSALPPLPGCWSGAVTH